VRKLIGYITERSFFLGGAGLIYVPNLIKIGQEVVALSWTQA